jgi:integrase
LDPVDQKKAALEARKSARTFGECAGELIEAKRSGWRSKIHAGQSTLETYCATLWKRPVDAIDTAAVLTVLKPIWHDKPETASRVRGRIEAVLDYAKAHGLRRTGENPAAWRGHLASLLSARTKLSRGRHAAMEYQQVAGRRRAGFEDGDRPC